MHLSCSLPNCSSGNKVRRNLLLLPPGIGPARHIPAGNGLRRIGHSVIGAEYAIVFCRKAL